MKVAVLMGSASDRPVMDKAVEVLDQFGVNHYSAVMSAHKTPEAVVAFASSARRQGYGVVIAGAGKAAHLAGVIASQTTLPVIGVPLSASLEGLDALLSTLQMPTGVPVATVAVDGAANAALLAVEILAVTDAALAEKLADYRRRLAAETLES